MPLLNSNFFEHTTIPNKTIVGLNSKFLNSSAENSSMSIFKTLKGVCSGKRNTICKSTPRDMNSDFLKNNTSIPSQKQKGICIFKRT